MSRIGVGPRSGASGSVRNELGTHVAVQGKRGTDYQGRFRMFGLGIVGTILLILLILWLLGAF